MAGNKGVVAAAVLVGFFGILPLSRMIIDSPPAPTTTTSTTAAPAPIDTQAAVDSADVGADIEGLPDAVGALLRERGVAQSVASDGDVPLPAAVVKLLVSRGAVLAVPESDGTP